MYMYICHGNLCWSCHPYFVVSLGIQYIKLLPTLNSVRLRTYRTATSAIAFSFVLLGF